MAKKIKIENLAVGDEFILHGKKRKVVLPPSGKRFDKGQYFVYVMLDGDRDVTPFKEHDEIELI